MSERKIRLGCFANPDKIEAVKAVGTLKEFLGSIGHNLIVKDQLMAGENIYDAVDYMIVLGGDGTVLGVFRESIDHDISLLGINMGNVGYLTDTDWLGAKMSIEKLIDGDFKVERRMVLKAEYFHNNYYALNDVVIHRGASPKLVEYTVDVNGERMGKFRADGVIISTPTGSTAYNMAAGGPVLKPDAEMIAITPISPHLLNALPVVVSHKDVISIKFPCDVGASVVVDGVDVGMLYTKDKIVELVIDKAEQTANIVKTHNKSFYDILNIKMKE